MLRGLEISHVYRMHSSWPGEVTKAGKSEVEKGGRGVYRRCGFVRGKKKRGKKGMGS